MAGIFDAIGGVVGGLFDADNSKRAAQRQYHKEKEFAQNSILWRVEDANRAGIHPLYAMGNPGIQAGPSPYQGSNFAGAGQNLGRAIDAMRSRPERNKAAVEEALDRSLIQHRTRAEIRLLEQQALSEQARRQDYQSGPPSPVHGTSERSSLMGNAGVVDYQPARPVNPSSVNPAREPGAITDYGFARNSAGGLFLVPSKDMKERTEDNPFLEAQWAIRNQFLPTFGSAPPAPSPKAFPIPPGYKWKYVRTRGAFYPFNPQTRKYIYRGKLERF